MRAIQNAVCMKEELDAKASAADDGKAAGVLSSEILKYSAAGGIIAGFHISIDKTNQLML